MDIDRTPHALAHEQERLMAHAGSTALAQAGRMLDALYLDTLAELATVPPDRLQFKQGALAQIKAVRQVLADPSAENSPKA
jgi:hypothetical protein